jgi:hypothetical protein
MSNEERESNLSGVWTGEYWYGAGADRTQFVAHIVETAGSLAGTTLEPASFVASGELSAVLTGVRDGYDVSFTKTYDAAIELGAAPIAYSGAADGALAVIEGEWRLLERNPLRGGFVVRRLSQAKESAKREVADTLTVVR